MICLYFISFVISSFVFDLFHIFWSNASSGCTCLATWCSSSVTMLNLITHSVTMLSLNCVFDFCLYCMCFVVLLTAIMQSLGGESPSAPMWGELVLLTAQGQGYTAQGQVQSHGLKGEISQMLHHNDSFLQACAQESLGCFNIKITFLCICIPIIKIRWLSVILSLCNEDCLTDKTARLYWNRCQGVIAVWLHSKRTNLFCS